METESGVRRFCERCNTYKPDRCHHCSVCDRCILKMDHHCCIFSSSALPHLDTGPWVNNCIGFYNYKYFLLFLIYTCCACLLTSLMSLHYVITKPVFLISVLFFVLEKKIAGCGSGNAYEYRDFDGNRLLHAHWGSWSVSDILWRPSHANDSCQRDNSGVLCSERECRLNHHFFSRKERRTFPHCSWRGFKVL